MQVYIGNATKQILQFAYRIPERKAPVVQPIPIYGQVRLAQDMNTPQIDALKEQWAKYGLVDCTEMESVRKEFEGYLISVGKPVPHAKLDRATHMRDDVLIRRGLAMRQEAAIAMINDIEAATPGAPIAKNYEISLLEIEPEKGFTNPNDTHVAERYITDPNQAPSTPPPAKPRRRRSG